MVFREGMANASVNDVKWTRFEFFIYASDIFADDTEEEEQYARKESHYHNQRGKALHGLMQKNLGIDCKERIENGYRNRACAQDRSGPDRYGRECEDSIRGEFEAPECAVFAFPGMALGTPDGDAGLTKPDPTPHSTKIAMVFLHATKLFHDAA